MAAENIKQRYISGETTLYDLTQQQRDFKMKRFADVASKIDNRRSGSGSRIDIGASGAMGNVDVNKIRPAD